MPMWARRKGSRDASKGRMQIATVLRKLRRIDYVDRVPSGKWCTGARAFAGPP
jgi:hypothetical protein